MNVINSNAGLVPVNLIQCHPDNPRKGDLSAVRASIRQNGFYGFVVAQRSTGYILVGNHRFEAAVQEGALEVPCVWLDVDDDRAKRIMLADNRTSDIGGYDDEKLLTLLEDLKQKDGGLIGTGYQDTDLGELLKKIGDGVNLGGEEEESGPKGVEPMGGLEYRILVSCTDEMHQTELLGILETMDLKCKPLIS